MVAGGLERRALGISEENIRGNQEAHEGDEVLDELEASETFRFFREVCGYQAHYDWISRAITEAPGKGYESP